MKAKYLSILTAIAAIAALASCTKEFFPDKPDAGQPGETLRTITLSFDTPTKSYLWRSPSNGQWGVEFNVGDSILVSNGHEVQICDVRPSPIDEESKVIFTKLEGPLTAVYPYTAALCEGNTITGIKVPSEQSGSFADANICKAGQDVEDEPLVFRTEVAILRFYTKGFEVDSIRIKSAVNPIASDKGYQITLVPKQQEIDNQAVAQQEMGQQVLTSEPDYWYAAIDVKQGAVAGKDLRFESVANTQDTTVVKQSTSEVKLSANTMYNVFIPYYIKLNVGTENSPNYQYWGYCNVGALTPSEDGEFFMWGEVKGHRTIFVAGNNEAFKDDFSIFDFESDSRYSEFANAEYGFAWKNTPYCSNFETPEFDRYNSSDNLITLKTDDDAATVNWGEGWRMPTKEEFEELCKKIKVSDFWSSTIGSGESVYRRGNWITTHYWSSCTCDEKSKAWSLSTEKNTIEIMERYRGYPIRPIYDPAPKSQSFTMTITPYTSGGTL